MRPVRLRHDGTTAGTRADFQRALEFEIAQRLAQRVAGNAVAAQRLLLGEVAVAGLQLVLVDGAQGLGDIEQLTERREVVIFHVRRCRRQRA